MARHARQQHRVMEWAVQRGRPFSAAQLRTALKMTDNAAHSALTKLIRKGSLVARKSKVHRGYEYILKAKLDKSTTSRTKEEEHEQINEVPYHLTAYATGYVSAWLDCFAASHFVSATALAREVGAVLQATKSR